VIQGIFPVVVVFPPLESDFHQQVLDICRRYRIPIIRPANVKDEGFIEELNSYSIDRIIVAGYHQIFPKKLLEIPRLGIINCHGGLLPEERGPIPWKWAIYENKAFTGVTIHQMTIKVDDGEVYFKEKVTLDKNETSESLFNKITESIVGALPRFFNDTDLAVYQFENIPDTKPGYRGQVSSELTDFDLSLTADELDRRVRAFSPRPGVFFENEQQKILVKKVEILQEAKPEGSLIFKTADYYIKLTDYEIVAQ
jgi:methionyl-tRNA formyltransferase